jgi:hypothetical protein
VDCLAHPIVSTHVTFGEMPGQIAAIVKNADDLNDSSGPTIKQQMTWRFYSTPADPAPTERKMVNTDAVGSDVIQSPGTRSGRVLADIFQSLLHERVIAERCLSPNSFMLHFNTARRYRRAARVRRTSSEGSPTRYFGG